MSQLRYFCPKCGKIYFKQDGSFSFECTKCDVLLKRVTNKTDIKANELAKKQLRMAERLIRAHDYPHFFGRKTFLE